MNTPNRLPAPVAQGDGGERLPLPPLAAMAPAQRAAAEALIAGPRKAVYGPFVPLLRCPPLLERVAQLGETLRFASGLASDVREFSTCLAAQRVGNQFEWVMHQPLALAAGVPAEALEALRVGATPPGLPPDLQRCWDFGTQLLDGHAVDDACYAAASEAFGEAGVVELATLIGYFVMVSWLMNVARTPSRPTAEVVPLP
jgi:4-carboxymuconolactone decarboxylase